MQMHLGRVLSGDCLLVFFVPLLCDASVGYTVWFSVREAAGEGLYLAAASLCLCAHLHTRALLFFKQSENICIPLNPACVALIISCMHQGFSHKEITRLKSHHKLPGEGSRWWWWWWGARVPFKATMGGGKGSGGRNR